MEWHYWDECCECVNMPACITTFSWMTQWLNLYFSSICTHDHTISHMHESWMRYNNSTHCSSQSECRIPSLLAIGLDDYFTYLTISHCPQVLEYIMWTTLNDIVFLLVSYPTMALNCKQWRLYSYFECHSGSIDAGVGQLVNLDGNSFTSGEKHWCIQQLTS